MNDEIIGIDVGTRNCKCIICERQINKGSKRVINKTTWHGSPKFNYMHVGCAIPYLRNHIKELKTQLEKVLNGSF